MAPRSLAFSNKMKNKRFIGSDLIFAKKKKKKRKKKNDILLIKILNGVVRFTLLYKKEILISKLIDTIKLA